MVWRFVGVAAFTFSLASLPSECDDLIVDWIGGEAPFRLLLIPPGGTIRNISIPASSFVDGRGTFRTPLTLRRNRRFIASMSDSTGFVAGGTSDLMIVHPPATNDRCNTTEPNVDFFFSLESDLEQCRPFPFTMYPNAIQPITLLGSIPGGQSFVLHPPVAASYSWMANIIAGTPVIFSMFDSLGRNGGTADVKIVRITNDTSCLHSAGPSSSTTGTADEPRKLSSGTIAAIVIGVLIFLASLPIVAILFIRYERKKSSQSVAESPSCVIDLTGGRSTPASSVRPDVNSPNDHVSVYAPRPFTLTVNPPNRPKTESTLEHHPSRVSSRINSGSVSMIGSGGPSRTSTRRSHVVVHSDIEEVDPSEAVVVELPPQYADRRMADLDHPIPGPGPPPSAKGGCVQQRMVEEGCPT